MAYVQQGSFASKLIDDHPGGAAAKVHFAGLFPAHLREGPWHPTAHMILIAVYAALVAWKIKLNRQDNKNQAGGPHNIIEEAGLVNSAGVDTGTHSIPSQLVKLIRIGTFTLHLY